jgi:hypothetical protein
MPNGGSRKVTVIDFNGPILLIRRKERVYTSELQMNPSARMHTHA